MIQIKSTTIFKQWLDNLKDLRARAKIQTRIKRLQMGNFGDVKPVGEGVSELRITEGKGYRVYLKNQNGVIVILLCAGESLSERIRSVKWLNCKILKWRNI